MDTELPEPCHCIYFSAPKAARLPVGKGRPSQSKAHVVKHWHLGFAGLLILAEKLSLRNVGERRTTTEAVVRTRRDLIIN